MTRTTEEAARPVVDAYTPKEVAALIGVHEVTLSRWRKQGTGPAWVKVGGRFRYGRTELEAWLRETARGGRE